MEAAGSSHCYWNSPPVVLQTCLRDIWSSLFLLLCHIFFSLPKEQEEEMSCWEGAEGGASRAQRHQSEGDMGHGFLCDDFKLDGLPGPKFRSLRHLRQVNNKSFPVTPSLILHSLCNETQQLKIFTSAAHISPVHICASIRVGLLCRSSGQQSSGSSRGTC